MTILNGVLGKGLALALVFVMGCTSVTDVRIEDLTEKERGRMAGIPGLRVYGYVPKGGEEQEIAAYVRYLESKGFRFQPVGPDAKVAAFTVAEKDLEALLLVRVDALKTAGGVVLVAIAIPVFAVFAIASGGAGDFVGGLMIVSSGGLCAWK